MISKQEMLDFKAQAEEKLIMAKAELSVINRLIEVAEAKEVECAVEVETINTEETLTDESY